MTTGVSPTPARQPFFSRPTTRLGRWAVGLAALFVALFLINASVLMRLQTEVFWLRTLLALYGIFMLLCGLGSAAAALVALLRRGERSWLVWLPLLPGLWVLLMLIGELLFPH